MESSKIMLSNRNGRAAVNSYRRPHQAEPHEPMWTIIPHNGRNLLGIGPGTRPVDRRRLAFGGPIIHA